MTAATPLLWFFGLLLSAGFNMNFWYLKKIGLQIQLENLLVYLLSPSRNDPAQMFSIIFIFLLGIISVWVLANWVKIFFMLTVADLLNLKRLGETPEDLSWIDRQGKILFQSKTFILPVLIVSLFTAAAQIITVLVFASPWIWQMFFAPMEYMAGIGMVLLVLFLFIFSVFNFFTVANIVIYQKGINDACAVAWQFIKAKLVRLLIFCLVLATMYAFGASLGLVFLIHVKPIVILWFGFLNSFFNLSLFLFYIANLRPRSFEKSAKNKKSFNPALVANPIK